MIDLLPFDSSTFSTNPSGGNSILTFIINAVLWCFEWLDSVGIMGVSLLDFFITVFLIGTFLPIIITVVKGHYINSARETRSEQKFQERSAQIFSQRKDLIDYQHSLYKRSKK